MPKRASSFRFLQQSLLLSLLISLPVHANQATDSSSRIDSPASGIPDACLSSQKSAGDIAGLLARLASAPSADLYDGLGTLYGRSGQFHCAVIAFEAALSLAPDALLTRYKFTLALIQDHQPARAIQELRRVLAQQPDWFAAYNALGLALQDQGDFKDAGAAFQSAIKANPRFALAYYDIGQLLTAQKRSKAAVYYLKQGLALSPSPELAMQMKRALAVAYGQLGKYAESVPLLEEAVAADAKSADLHFELATAYAHCDKYPEAVKEYEEVLGLDPGRTDAELLLAKALLNRSRFQESLPYLRDYVARKPQDAEGLEILGDALKESSAEPGEAIPVLRRAVAANPSSYKAYYDLGVVLGRSGRPEEAIAALRSAIKLKPDGSEARYQLARLLAKAGQQSAAKEQFAAFERLKEKDRRQTDAAVLNGRASDLLRQGRDQDAITAYRQALSITPNDPQLHYNLAIVLSETGDRSGKQNELQQALKLDPKFTQAHNELGSEYLRDGRFPEAEREFRTAVETDPQSVEGMNNLGTTFGRQGKNDQAEQLFRRAIDLDPEHPLGFVNLGLTLASARKYADAEQEFLSALKLDPNNTNALTALGMLQGKTGRSDESVKTFRRVVALEPKAADAHLNLGMALGDANDLEGALEQFSEAARLSPTSALAHYNRGRTLYALHRTEEARESLNAAVRSSPDYVDALLLLGVIEHTSARATELFQRVVNLEPRNSKARFYLGRNLLQAGKKEEAVAQWKKSVELDADNLSALSSLTRTLTQSKSPEAGEYMERLEALQKKQQLSDRVKELNNFALRSAEEKNWEQAVGQLQEAIDLCKQCVQIGLLRKNIGLIYARKGDIDHAKEQLEIALKLLPSGPDNLAVLQALQRLTVPSGTAIH